MPDLRSWSRARWLAILIVALGLLILVGANAHLLYVAMTSQPDCVSHSRTAGAAPGDYRAARSSC